jgi:Domain of Unknown Function (DUF1080)
MTVRRSVPLALVAIALAWTIAPIAVAQAPHQATPLLNGRDFTGWRAEPASSWRVDEGTVVHEGTGSASLRTERDFGDFELKAEYQTPADSRTSILLRDAALFSLDSNRSAQAWTPLSIVIVGERVTLAVNGVAQVVHTRAPNARQTGQPLPQRGPLVLTTAGPARFRNISVREIGGVDANAILATHDGAGFVPVFNGESFDGWAGPIDNYQVVGGAILCKPGKGGTIYTKSEYRDFKARLEFKLPPGGNNGLAIRYPGEGDAAYAGMTELQVLDNTAAKYATLDPRQFHGSAYGMVPAVKGYLRPVGEWNFEEVTVQGSTIIVELNGTRILDADLSTVKAFMANSPHPGKDRTSGHFGFAGHGDPVQFRQVQIKALP